MYLDIQNGGGLGEAVYGEKPLKVSSSHRNSHLVCAARVNGARGAKWVGGHETVRVSAWNPSERCNLGVCRVWLGRVAMAGKGGSSWFTVVFTETTTLSGGGVIRAHLVGFRSFKVQ